MDTTGKMAAVLIEDPATLRQAMDCLSMVDAVALDTEFIRSDTFYSRLGLVQLSDGRATWLVDPLLFTKQDLSPLIELLVDQEVVKVIHSCSEDLEVLRHALGVIPEPIFDTQVAAAFIGLGPSLSYQALVKEFTGVDLPKHETRSNWLNRPLSESQLRYAAEDVEHLLTIRNKLAQRLGEQGKLAWFEEDMEALLTGARREVSAEEYYLKVSGAWKLERQSLAILKSLCSWRESQARQEGRPRSWIIADKELLHIATEKIDQKHLLGDETDIHPRTVRSYGKELVGLVNQVLIMDPALSPPALARPLSGQSSATLKSCRQLVRNKAAELSMVPEILARRADLVYLIRAMTSGQQRLPPRIESGWRKLVVGEPLLAHIEEKDTGQA
jgi:ribonuclease D